MKNKRKNKVWLVILYICSFVVSLVPLVICFVLNWGDYTKKPSDTIRLSLGGIAIVTLIFMKVIGKLKMPCRIVSFGIAFVMAYLLQAVLNDLLLLTGMALLGEFIDYAIFQRAIRKMKEDILVRKTADVTTAQVEEVVQKYIGRT